MLNSTMKQKNSVIRQILTILILMLLVIVAMAILSPDTYFTPKNAKSMIFQFPEFGILSFGMMLCMIGGGIDISLVGIMNLSGMTAALVMLALIPNESTASDGKLAFALLAACACAIAVGALCGIFNGLIIGYFKIPAMLVTLCSLQLFNGLVYAVTGGTAVTGMCASFKEIANGTIPGTWIPWVLPIFVVVTAAVALILHQSKLGKEIFYLGSNRVVSEYSGLSTLKISVLTHMISGILGGVSGILITSHMNAAKSSNGTSYTLLSILIVVLGGVHPNGGRGNIIGVTLSVILMQMVTNAFTLLRISQDVKNFANGVLLILTLVLVIFLQKADEKKRTNM
ncbi:MAG TPA: ABC transporter permease [Ruminococcaceae bacterium]|nr:ABC transporter permease [Oscillospiraceae bacterium]